VHPGSTYKDKVRLPGYPVEELGGLIFAYLGPQPAPLLPRFDLFVESNRLRSIGRTTIPCNWLQIMENSVDPTHAEWLHGWYFAYVLDRMNPGGPNAAQHSGFVKHHVKIGFDVFEWGIIKRRLLEGGSEADEDWAVGHPLIFPHMLQVGLAFQNTFQIRVPVDDTTTEHYWYSVEAPDEGVELPPQKTVPVYQVPYREENGAFIVDYVDGQDIMCWITQGPIADRSQEHLGTSDKGVILLRSLLTEQIERVQRGEDPIGVIRDPAKNHIIRLPQEKNKGHQFVGQRERRGPDRNYLRYNPESLQFRTLLKGNAR
jgi:5,5'-dehydrodivanillate O-demethylase